MSSSEASVVWSSPLVTANGSSDRTAQLLKGLQHAKNRIDQVLVEDCKFPDLFEQLSNQGEPQNYFFEPYATQWCPQILKKGSVIPLPPVVAASLDQMKTITLSGLMPEINHAWSSVDNRLFLWNYTKRGKFTMFDFEQVIVAVGLCVTPVGGVFTDKVRHLLVVATSVEVIILAVLYEDNDVNSIRLQRTKLSVSADNCVVRKITCSSSGRIFFGGSDGDLYEVIYEQQDQMIPFFNRSCRKISHTGSYLNYLPSFLSGLVTMPGKVVSIVIDEERSILYTLHDNAHVMVYDLGVTSKQTKAICSLNLLDGGAKYARDNRRIRVSCPDERIFQNTGMQVVSLCVVPREESAFVTLVAVSSNGIRFYLSVFSRNMYTVGTPIPRSRRPTGLNIVFIRLPPPAIALSDAPTYHGTEGMQPGYAPGKSPSKVHTAFHKQGVFLMVDGGKDEQDQLIGIAHDPITSCIPTQTSRKPTIRESISLDSCNGKVVQIEELSERCLMSEGDASSVIASSRGTLKRSFDEMTNGSSGTMDQDVMPIIGEMTSQYSQTSRHFLCLTNAGVQLFKKVRPIDQLHHILLQSRSGELKAALAPFVRFFGEVQVCAMLLAIACGVHSDALLEGDKSSKMYLNAKNDELTYSTAIQAIFECGQIAVNENYSSKAEPTNTRIVMTTEMEMSYQHDGLYIFVCRVLRPLWYPRMLGKYVRNAVNDKKSQDFAPSSSSTTRVFELIHSASSLEKLREILFQLRQLMEGVGPYSVSISSGSVLQKTSDISMLNGNMETNSTYPSRVAELANRYQRGRSEDQLKREKRVKQEQQSLFFLYELVLRCIEGISLLQIGIEQKLPIDESVARLSFGELVATADGVVAAKQMIKHIMRGRNENNQHLIRRLREQCPAFFSIADLWHYQGYKSLATAKMSAPNAKETHLKESLKQFLNSCHMWNTEDSIEVLQRVCEDYAMLGFYEGVVKLSLACAKNFAEHETQEPVVIRTSQSKLRRACFNRILVALKRLLADAGHKVQTGKAQPMQNGSSPQSVSGMDAMVNTDEETRTRQVDDLLRYAIASESLEFHELLYTWLLENGFTDMLTKVRSSFIEEFLKEKDQDLLVRLYMDQQRYLTAARVWWNRAHEVNEDNLENNPDLSQRQFFISKALCCLKSIDDLQHVEVESGVFSSAMDAVKEVSDVLDVLQLQLRVLNAMKQTTIELEASATVSAEELRQRRDAVKVLTFKMLDASSLYNQFAARYQMWTECLFIIQTCDSDERDIVAALWAKIIYSLIPSSSSDQEFNLWRREQYDATGLSTQKSYTSTFESGIWIGELQCKLLRLGRALYSTGHEARTVVFSVEALAPKLERLAIWYERVTNQQRNGSSMVDLMLNWVIKLFLDIGVPHGVLLGHYEQMFRKQGDQRWVLHISQCIYCLVVLWKQYVLSPRASKETLMEFGGACPAIADFCGDLIIELKTTITEEESEAAFLLDRFRKLQNDVVAFRSSVVGN